MKRICNIFICLALLTTVISCEGNDEIPDPIIGNWKLMERTINGVTVDLNDCLSKNRIEFTKFNEAYFDGYRIDEDTQECENSTYTQTWGNDDRDEIYGIYNGSLINQRQVLRMEDEFLIHSFEGWDFEGYDLITSDIVNKYVKE